MLPLLKKTNEQVLSRIGGKSLADRAAMRVRGRMYRRLERLVPLARIENVLDVGVTADRLLACSNFFENLYPFPDRVTAFSDQDASWMETEYPGLKFVRGTALAMPFPDAHFDLVFSNAVIEHVGSWENQKKFLCECLRVTKRFLFITTPNRWHPVEFHTVLPLLHWFPKKIHRRILKFFGMSFFALENNLNLLSKKDLLNLAGGVAPPPPPPSP